MTLLAKNVSDRMINKIHETAMKILDEKGVRFTYPRALETFRKNGFRVEDRVVYFTEAQARAALAQVPTSFVLRGREEKYDVKIGEGGQAFVPSYGPVFVSRCNERRKANREDVVNFAKLSWSSPVINVMNPYTVAPGDVDAGHALMYQQAACLKYSAKPTMGIAAGYESAKESIRLVRKINARTPDDYVTIGLCEAISPLTYDDHMAGSIFAYAEENQPIVIGCGDLTGATSSVSCIGTMATVMAELISGLTLAQLIRPGLPCVFGSVAMSTDMRYVTPAIGTPEAARFAILEKAMAEYYGNIPCRSGGTSCDAKQTDFEAGAESMLLMMTTMAAGMDYIIHTVGIMDSYNIIGYEKFVLDEQTVQAIQFTLKEPAMDDDTIGLDTIMEVDHGCQYLMEPHTMEYMRQELFTPAISLHGIYDVWKNNGAKTILDLANEAIDKRLADYQLPELDAEKAALLDRYLNV